MHLRLKPHFPSDNLNGSDDDDDVTNFLSILTQEPVKYTFLSSGLMTDHFDSFIINTIRKCPCCAYTLFD